MVLSCDSNQKAIKDSTAKGSAIETVAILTQIHLQMLGAGAVVGSVDKCLCIADNPVAVSYTHLTLPTTPYV